MSTPDAHEVITTSLTDCLAAKGGMWSAHVLAGLSRAAGADMGEGRVVLRYCPDGRVEVEGRLEARPDPDCESCDGTGAAWDDTEGGSFDCADCSPVYRLLPPGEEQ